MYAEILELTKSKCFWQRCDNSAIVLVKGLSKVRDLLRDSMGSDKKVPKQTNFFSLKKGAGVEFH